MNSDKMGHTLSPDGRMADSISSLKGLRGRPFLWKDV